MTETTAPTSLSEYLPDNYQAPWGTALSPDNFQYADGVPNNNISLYQTTGEPDCVGYWQIRISDDTGKEITYAIGQPKNNACDTMLWVDGVATKPSNLITKQQRWLPVSETYDFVLREDARFRLSNSQPEWGGQTIDAMLRRAEFGISTYTREERNLQDFTTTTELQTWLNNELATSTVKAEVFEVLPGALGLDPLPLFTRHWHPGLECHLHGEMGENDVETKQSKYLVNFKESAAKFYGQANHGVIAPELSVSHDGTLLQAYEGDSVVSLDSILNAQGGNDNIAWAGDNGNSTDCTGANDWWGIAIREFGLSIVFPKNGTNLLVSTDHDGAKVTISAEATNRRSRINYLVDQFERQWGKWVDPSANLTDTEIGAGIAAAEATVVQEESGSALTQRLLEQWVQIRSASLPSFQRPTIIPIHDAASLLVVGNNVALVMSLPWPTGEYTVADDGHIMVKELGATSALDDEDPDKVFSLITTDFEKYLEQSGYKTLNAPDLSIRDQISNWQTWINELPATLDDIQLTPVMHIGNKPSEVFRSKGWFTSVFKLIETERFSDYLDDWFENISDKQSLSAMQLADLAKYATILGGPNL